MAPVPSPMWGPSPKRPGGHVDHHADEVEQRLLQEPVQLRVGADEEPGWRASVETERGRRRWHGSGCPRPGKAPRAVHADHGSLAAVRPGIREDFAALL